MANGIRTGDPHGFNKGCSSKFREGSRVRQTPEEGRRTYWPKRCGNNNKDEDNSPKTLNDEKLTFYKKKNAWNVCICEQECVCEYKYSVFMEGGYLGSRITVWWRDMLYCNIRLYDIGILCWDEI